MYNYTIVYYNIQYKYTIYKYNKIYIFKKMEYLFKIIVLTYTS